MRRRIFAWLPLAPALFLATPPRAIPPQQWSQPTGYTRDGCTVPNGDFVSTGSIAGTVDFGDTSVTAAGNSDVFVARYNEDGNTVWVRTAGKVGGSVTTNTGVGIAPDGAGGCFVLGSYSEALTFDTTTVSTDDHAFVARYSDTGELHWVVTFSVFDYVRGVAADATGGCYIWGEDYDDAYQFVDVVLVRLDSSGAVLWQLNGSDDALAHTICSDDAGNAIVAGHFRTQLTFGDSTLTGNGAFMGKVAPNSDVLWLRNITSSSFLITNDIVADAAGDIYIGGHFLSSVVLPGTTLVANTLYFDGFVARFDAIGDFTWAREVDAATLVDEAQVLNLDVTPAGNVVASARYFNKAIVDGDTLAGDGGLLVEWGADGSLIDYLDSGSTGVVGLTDVLQPIAVNANGTLYRWIYDDSLVAYRDLASAILRRTATHPSAELLPGHPNPFNPATTLSFRLSVASEVDLSVFDVAGRRVRTLVAGRRGAGLHREVWDGTDDRGRSLASGVYFARLRAGSEVSTRKMVLIK